MTMVVKTIKLTEYELKQHKISLEEVAVKM